MPYVNADGAEAYALGPVSGGSLAITAGRGALFAAAGPSPSAPLPLAVFRGPEGLEVLIGAVLVTAVATDSLTISGAVPGYALPTIQAGDVVASVPLKADGKALWDAMALRPTATQVDASIAAAIGALPAYATTGYVTAALADYALSSTVSDLWSAMTTGLGAKQNTLTPGSISTSLLADGGVLTAKIGDAAVTKSKIHPDARPLFLLGRWRTSTSVAASLGDMDGVVAAPLACTLHKIVIRATVNPSGAGGGAVVQLKVGASSVLTIALALPAGTVGPVSWTLFTNAAVADQADVVPTLITSIGGDLRGLLVDVWAREA